MPELQRQLEELHAGNETQCTLRQAARKHHCRQEGPPHPGKPKELWCFCPGDISARDDRASVESKVVLGPSSDLDRNTSEWCREELAKAWPNVILLEHVGQKHWSCNVIVDDDAEPCHSDEAEKRARERQSRHWRCFSDIMYNTKRHHSCVTPLVSDVETPCVRLLNGRLLLGDKDALLGQLDEHHGSYQDNKQWILMVTATLFFAGLVVASISFCCCLFVWHTERLKGTNRKNSTSSSRTTPTRVGRSRAYRGGEIECRMRPNTNNSERG